MPELTATTTIPLIYVQGSDDDAETLNLDGIENGNGTSGVANELDGEGDAISSRDGFDYLMEEAEVEYEAASALFGAVSGAFCY